ncbi:MAG: hypothetical protein R3C28_32445 [Pirellulaceae bacterium]
MNEERAKHALISIACCIVVIFAVYLFWGRDISNSANVAMQTAAAQKQTAQRVVQSDERMALLQAELKEIQSDIESRALSNDDMSALQNRISGMEQMLSEDSIAPGDFERLTQLRLVDDARQRADLASLTALFDKCKTALDATNRYLQTWENDLQNVSRDERGKRIAASNRVLERVDAILSQPHITRADYDTWSEQLSLESRPYIEAYEAGTPIALGDDATARFEAILQRVDEANEALFRRQSIVQRAIADCSQIAPANVALMDAMGRLREDRMTRFADENATAREAALRDAAKRESDRIQAAQAERMAADADFKIAKEDAERLQIEAARQQIVAANADVEQALREKRLMNEFARDEAEINSLLKPFITDSDRQPTRGDDNAPKTWITVSRPFRPVSWGALSGSGALDDSLEGRQRLLFVGGSDMTFRPRGSFPAYSRTAANNPNVEQALKRSRELLLKYGQILVDKGMMSP